MPSYPACNNLEDLNNILTAYKAAVDTSSPDSRTFKQREDIYNKSRCAVDAFPTIDRILQHVRTKQDIEHRDKFYRLANYLRDLTGMLIALKEFNDVLDNNSVMFRDNLKASVPPSILQNFELTMNHSSRTMSDLADTITCGNSHTVKDPWYINFKRKDTLLLTDMLKSAKDLYLEPENGNKLIAFSNCYSELPSRVDWCRHLKTLAQTIIGYAMVIIPSVLPLAIATLPVVSFVGALLMITGICVIATAGEDRKVNLYRTNDALSDLAEVKSSSKSFQKAYMQHSLLRPPVREQDQVQANLEQPLYPSLGITQV